MGDRADVKLPLTFNTKNKTLRVFAERLALSADTQKEAGFQGFRWAHGVSYKSPPPRRSLRLQKTLHRSACLVSPGSIPSSVPIPRSPALRSCHGGRAAEVAAKAKLFGETFSDECRGFSLAGRSFSDCVRGAHDTQTGQSYASCVVHRKCLLSLSGSGLIIEADNMAGF